MVDIHTHLLMLIEKDNLSLEKFIEILKHQYSLGITDVFLTPHHRTNENKYSKKEIVKIYNQILNNVKNIDGLPKLYLGQVNLCEKNIYSREEKGEIITLSDSNAVLLEYNVADYDVVDFVYNFTVLGYTPIIAHAERHLHIDEHTITSIKLNGGLIQISAPSVIGCMGKPVQKFVLKLIKKGLVDFIASDFHLENEFLLKDAYDFINKKFKRKVADDLFINNAKKYILK